MVYVSGGVISGPEEETDVSRPNKDDDNCQSVLPQEHNLYQVACATEQLQRDSSATEEYGVGRRSGFTPVINVL